MSTAYVLPNEWEHARQRLANLEAAYDPGTLRHLSELGVGPGWTCLEVGAGGGTVASWLADRVGPEGRVVATDIDPRFLRSLGERPNVAVLVHDIAEDPLPEQGFDLVHTRLVLEHLTGRDQALRRMAGALKPGGWLFVESIDFASEQPDPRMSADWLDLFDKVHCGRITVLEDRGFDHGYARGLARRFAEIGMLEVGGEARAFPWIGGGAGTGVVQHSVMQVRTALVALGSLTDAEADRAIEMLGDPSFLMTSPAVMAVWGRATA